MDLVLVIGVIGLNLGSIRLSWIGFRMVYWWRLIVVILVFKESWGCDEVEYRGRVLCEIGVGLFL